MTHSKENLHIEGHKGTWYVIDEAVIAGHHVWLLESEVWGDEAPCLIVYRDTMTVALEEVYNGFEDLYESLGM